MGARPVAEPHDMLKGQGLRSVRVGLVMRLADMPGLAGFSVLARDDQAEPVAAARRRSATVPQRVNPS